jgi:hypothetical protein
VKPRFTAKNTEFKTIRPIPAKLEGSDPRMITIDRCTEANEP